MPVEIKGLAETLTAMRKFEPDLAKNLNKEVRAALTPIQKQAQGYVPNSVPGLSNWMLKTKSKKINKETSAFAKGKFPKFNGALVRRGIKIYIGKTTPNNKGFVTFYRLVNETAAGAIMETSGRAHGESRRQYRSNNPEAGRHFINSQPGKLKGDGLKKGRLIYRAWDEDQGKALANVMKALDTTIVQFRRRADSQVFRDAA